MSNSLHWDTPIGRKQVPEHEAKRVRQMSDEELEDNLRTERGFIDPSVLAERERRKKEKLGLPTP